MKQRYILNRATGEVIDSCRESLVDFRNRTENWAYFLVVISEKVYKLINQGNKQS